MLQRFQQRYAHSLLAQPQFRRLWCNFFVSEIGARMSAVLIPLLAITVLHAGPLQTGIMVAAHAGAIGIASLLAGVLADRIPPKRLLITGQAVLSMALLTIPAAYMLGCLSIAWLCVLELVIGTGLALIVTAGQVYAARVVEPARVVEAYSLIFGADSIAALLGPGLAGWLVGVLSPAWAVSVDTLCILIAIALLLPNADAPGEREAHDKPASLAAEFTAGWRVLWNDPLLRLLTLCMAVFHILLNGHGALHVLLSTVTLGLTPALFGMLMMFGGLGALTASFATAPVAARFGEKNFMPAALGLLAVSWLAFAAMPSGQYAALLFAPVVFAYDMAVTSYSILFVSTRQIASPPALLGRIASTTRFIAFTVAPLGGVVFGWVAEHAGMRTTYVLLGVLAMGLALGLGWRLRGSRTPDKAVAAA